MADLLSTLIQILAPAAGPAFAAREMAGPMPTGPKPSAPPLRISGPGTMQQPDMASPLAVPPGMAVADNPGAMPVSDEIRKLFEPAAQPQPVAAPQPRPAMPSPQQPLVRPTQQTGVPADPSTTGTITAADVQRFIRSVATGAGKADPRAPGMAAFAQGAMGALQNSYGETEREKAQKLAERRADTADRRADTALALGERRERRAEDELARRTKRDEAVERERQVRMRERLARIAKIDDQRLDSKDIGRIGDQVNRHARYLQVEVNNARMTPEQAEQSLQQYKRDVIEQYVRRDPAAKAPPVGAQPPAATQPTPGQIYRHNGQQYRLKPGADPTKPESYEKVN